MTSCHSIRPLLPARAEELDLVLPAAVHMFTAEIGYPLMLKATGGIAPPQRLRPRWMLSLAEREEIAEGRTVVASGADTRRLCVQVAAARLVRLARDGGLHPRVAARQVLRR